jgi:formylmethanofuran dehydrogenase subunit B
LPTIVLGRSGMQFQTPPAVYIPVATSGIHHSGNTFRGDSTVSLRLRKLMDSPLLPVHEVLYKLIKRGEASSGIL